MCSRALVVFFLAFSGCWGSAQADSLLLFPEKQFGTANLTLPQSNAQYGSALETLGSRSERFEPLADKRTDDLYRRLGLPIGRIDLLVQSATGERGVATCTASLIDIDKLITNYHCVPGLDPGQKLLKGEIRLGYLRQAFEEGQSFPVNLTPLEADADLDYSILETSSSAGKIYGTVLLNSAVAVDNESLFIIHHPAGQPQRLTRAFCNALPVKPVEGTVLRHRCDTLPGSSGSLIFSAREAVFGKMLVGVHHAGGLNSTDSLSFNEGTDMQTIIKASKILSLIAKASALPTDIEGACKKFPALC
jgi:V8-like Glu-specific endopeptidase